MLAPGAKRPTTERAYDRNVDGGRVLELVEEFVVEVDISLSQEQGNGPRGIPVPSSSYSFNQRADAPDFADGFSRALPSIQTRVI